MEILPETKKSVFKISVLVLLFVTFVEVINFALRMDYYASSILKGSLWSYWVILVAIFLIDVIRNRVSILELFEKNKTDFFLLFLLNADLVFLGYMFVAQFLK